MTYTEERQLHDSVPQIRAVSCTTPIGEFIIMWHKNVSITNYSVKLNDEIHVGTAPNLSDAKELVVRYLELKLKELGDYLGQNYLSEIENAMERWHHARDNDGETLQKINDILVENGMLGWFNEK